MNKFVLCTIGVLFLLVGACQQEENTPDLTTALTGHHPVDYLIVDQATNQTYIGGPTGGATIHISRKNNNTLLLDIDIKDSTIQLRDHLQASVSLDNLANDGLLIKGLINRYKLAYAIGHKGTGESSINLYNDGKIRGSVSYISRERYQVSVGIMP